LLRACASWAKLRQGPGGEAGRTDHIANYEQGSRLAKRPWKIADFFGVSLDY
jgi:hypothetical protein